MCISDKEQQQPSTPAMIRQEKVRLKLSLFCISTPTPFPRIDV